MLLFHEERADDASQTFRGRPRRRGHRVKPAELRFFRNYNRTIGVAYAALLLGLAGFFAYQLQVNMRKEVAFIQGEVERHGQLMEFVLRSSTDQVEALRMAAGRSVASEDRAARRCGNGDRLGEARQLREGARGFDRDGLIDRDAGGNLVGEGRLAGRDAAFYCDLESALALDGHLRSLAFHLPNAARTRFVSAQGFHLVAPWRPAREIPFERRLYEDPVWRAGQPAANPDRQKYWAPVVFGGQDVGLLAPVAAPVYDRDRFMGVLAVDMSLDYLHRVNASFGYPLGAVSLVDGDGRVLAHPGLYADPLSVQAPARLQQVFSPAVLPSVQALAQLPDGQAVQRGGTLLIRHAFSAAPWQMVYSVPRGELWAKLLLERAPSMLVVLLGMGLLMVITYVVSSREFVGPAAKLVTHLVAESNFQPQPVPKVPKAWRPWFDAITRAFRQSVELTLLRKELDIAARMQQSILPRHWPDDPRFDMWGTTVAAREVGGDFYDHFPLAGGRCAMVVADVSGKGIGAGLFAMVSKTLLRSVATQRQAAPSEVALHVNNGLCADNDASMFVTTFHAQYDPATGRMAYVNAGHPPPLLIAASGATRWLPATGGTAFGVMEDLSYKEAQWQLVPGDTLLMFTDGVSEAENAQGEQFGQQRLQALFEGRPTTAPREAIERVLKAVNDFASGTPQFDDITCMAVHCDRVGEVA